MAMHHMACAVFNFSRGNTPDPLLVLVPRFAPPPLQNPKILTVQVVGKYALVDIAIGN